MRIETKCLTEGYKPGNGDPRVLPICQSTTFTYDSSEQMGDLFDLKLAGHFYTRLSNPTVESVENKIAALEGGVGAIMTSSGQSASLFAILNICHAGDHVVCSSAIYGGTLNLFGFTLKKYGIEFTFIDPASPDEEIQNAIKPNTKAIFGETLTNPSLRVLDIERYARVAHANNIPLIVDNTFPTPILCRPFEYGADVVLHSTTKYMDGHAMALGGVIVDSGNFDWGNGKFPEFIEPDESYHGLIFAEHFGKAAYIAKARCQLMRDLGSSPSPFNAFLLNAGLETLHLRMERHSQNALKVAEFLKGRADWVNYPGLVGNVDYELAQKYLPNGTSGVISFGIKGGRQAAVRFMDSLKLINIATHVADVRSCVLHPAGTTHRQLSDEALAAAGIPASMIRLSVGIENVDDLLEDIEQAMM